MSLYDNYQTFYDFKLSKMTFKELNKKAIEDDEWIPDDIPEDD